MQLLVTEVLRYSSGETKSRIPDSYHAEPTGLPGVVYTVTAPGTIVDAAYMKEELGERLFYAAIETRVLRPISREHGGR